MSYSYCVSMMIDVCSDNSFIHAVQVNFSNYRIKGNIGL